MGRKVKETDESCSHCGAPVKEIKIETKPAAAPNVLVTQNFSRAAVIIMGVVFGFMHFIGLLIGFVIFRADPPKLRTFLKVWGITVGIYFAFVMFAGLTISFAL